MALRTKLHSFLQKIRRYYKLRHAIKRISALQAPGMPSRELLQDLRIGWGNEAYSADIDYLEEVARRALDATGPVLECGSGLTTIILGLLAGRRGIDVRAFEHDAAWRSMILSTLRDFRIDGVGVHLTPLRGYGEFNWYDISAASLPPTFSLVVCDGPPEATHGGRLGLLPLMRKHLAAGSLVLFDDANTKIGSEVLSRWVKDWNVDTQFVIKPEGTYAAVKIRNM